MNLNEMPNEESLKRDISILLKDCEKHRGNKEDLLQQVNNSIKYLQSQKSFKSSEIYEMTKNHTDLPKLIELEGEMKGLDSGIYQLKKVKALLKSFVL